MLKTLLVATTAFTLISGVGFAESTYSSSKTETTSGMGTTRDVDVSRSVRTSSDRDGTVVEKEKTVKERSDNGGAHVTLEIGRDHDRDVTHKEKTVNKSTEVSPTGEVTRNKSETTTIR